MRARTLAVFLGALTAFGCGTASPPALRVRVLVSADVAATCIVVEATGGGATAEAKAPRGAGSDDLHFSLERGLLPDQVRVRALAGYGEACSDPLVISASSAEQEGTFASPPGAAVILQLSAPAAGADADGDGFSSIASGGGDCNDQDPTVHPGAPEVCALGMDADCDNQVGCADPDCASVPCSTAATQLRFVTSPQTVEGGACSTLFQLRTVDAAGALAAVPVTLPVTLSVSTPDALRFFADPACRAPLGSPRLGPGGAGLDFFVRAVTGGGQSLEASAPQLGTATQTVTVAPMVRTGQCTLPQYLTSVSCPLAFPVDPARSLLVFQATMDDVSVSSTNVRCSIASGRAVACNRVGTTGAVGIAWQVLRREQGLAARHLRFQIGGGNATLVSLNPPVSQAGATFLLSSYQNSGDTQGDDDFRHLRLSRIDQLEVRGSSGGGGEMEVTVAELAGATVTRGLAGPMDTLQLGVSNLPPVDLGRSFLTYSFRTLASGSRICDRTLRGELTSPTTLRFLRGDGTAACADALVDAIAWERVELPPGWRVQQVEVDLAAGQRTRALPLAQAVDVTRTLVLAGGQYTAGQAMGEGSHELDDRLGEMLGRLTLTGASELTVSRDTSRGSARWTAFVVEVPP